MTLCDRLCLPSLRRCKVQNVVATSSTEAEFIAAITAAKTAKFLCSVLTDLGFPPAAPTTLHCDNIAAINMVNSCKPTPRARQFTVV